MMYQKPEPLSEERLKEASAKARKMFGGTHLETGNVEKRFAKVNGSSEPVASRIKEPCSDCSRKKRNGDTRKKT